VTKVKHWMVVITAMQNFTTLILSIDTIMELRVVVGRVSGAKLGPVQGLVELLPVDRLPELVLISRQLLKYFFLVE
jgi:hypothetical protein